MQLIDSVIKAIEKNLYLEPNSIHKSYKRTREVSYARWIAIKCIMKLVKWRKYRVARYLALDHTSVNYALEKVDEIISKYEKYQNAYDCGMLTGWRIKEKQKSLLNSNKTKAGQSLPAHAQNAVLAANQRTSLQTDLNTQGKPVKA